MKLIEKQEWGKYVSPISDKTNSPFNWYSFKHRFGSGLVDKMVNEFALKNDCSILDPFCGGGTTLIKAKLEGFKAIGIDISPFSVFLSNTLTTKISSEKLKKILPKISHKIDTSVKIPDVELLNRAFTLHALQYIYSLKNSINTLKMPERNFFLLCLLSVLNDNSKAKKSGGFLRITDQRKVAISKIKTSFILVANKFIDELESFKFSSSNVKAYMGDARKYPKEIKNMRFDAILTSPPYPNRHDYTRIYELELLTGFIKSNKSLKKLRYKTLRSHVEAKKVFGSKKYKVPNLLKNILEELGKFKLNNPQIISTLSGYFEDMYISLKEMFSVLKEKGKIGLVVSNVRFAGITIPVDVLLSEIGKQVGLKEKNIYVLRYRGNSSQQMQLYKRIPARESLIIWEKS